MVIINDNRPDGNINIGPSETEVVEMLSLVVDRLSLRPPIRPARRALIVDVRSNSELWFLECAIYSRRHGTAKEIMSVDDLCIDVDGITPSPRCLETQGFWDLQDFDRTLRCDDGTCTATDIAQRVFGEVNADEPLRDLKECCRAANDIQIRLQMKIRAPTNEWRMDHTTPSLIRITEQNITSDLEDMCRDITGNDLLSMPMALDCAMMRQDLRDQSRHYHFEYSKPTRKTSKKGQYEHHALEAACGSKCTEVAD
ncbi:hypothetical protein CSUB01_05970 [Colletotrichum sublineola]|uniref:Uncharacterized protein n=1 Tax=Colletotrichum sublineola TaxID=1173701 RepID=A0A066WV70_COLSU|nr:hypothetical protein CSUB01_05970 [Colletotrichum sublineola]